MVTDQSDHASPHPYVTMYVVGRDVCDVDGRVVCELLGQLATDVLCLLNGNGLYVHIRYLHYIYNIWVL